MFRPLPLWVALTAASAIPADGARSVSWMIDETLNRGDTELFWTSPTAIDVGLGSYTYTYEIIRIQATASLFGSPFTINVAPFVADTFGLTGDGAAPSLPTVLLQEALNDDTTGTSAEVFIEVDEMGFGQAAFTNVVLGAANVPVFGRRDIESVRVEGVVNIQGGTAGEPADFTGDGAVDPADFDRWSNEYGRTDATITADATADGRVDAADYTVWRDRFESSLDAIAAPEPGVLPMALTALIAALTRPASRRPGSSRTRALDPTATSPA